MLFAWLATPSEWALFNLKNYECKMFFVLIYFIKFSRLLSRKKIPSSFLFSSNQFSSSTMYSRFHIKIVLFLVSFSFSFLFLCFSSSLFISTSLLVHTDTHTHTERHVHTLLCAHNSRTLLSLLLLPISIRASRYTLCLWHCTRFAFKAKSQKKSHRNRALCYMWVQ